MKYRGEFPAVTDRAHVHLVEAYHPLLYLYNQKANKPTIPVTITLDDAQRILVISGPNAGGKTVTLKTVGLIADDGAEWLAGTGASFIAVWDF